MTPPSFRLLPSAIWCVVEHGKEPLLYTSPVTGNVTPWALQCLSPPYGSQLLFGFLLKSLNTGNEIYREHHSNLTTAHHFLR